MKQLLPVFVFSIFASTIVAGCSLPKISELSVSPVQEAAGLYKQRKFAQSQVLAEKAVHDQRDLGFAYTMLAQSLCAQGKFAQAEPLARNAVEKLPSVANTHAALASVFIGLGNYSEAEGEIRQALSLPQASVVPPSRAQQQVIMGRVLQMQGQPLDAVEQYKSAITLEPALPDAYAAYGDVLNDLGKFDQAELALRRATQLAPDNVQSSLLLERCLIEQDKLEEAVKISVKLMQTADNNPGVQTMQSYIYYKVGKYAEAEAAARQAILRDSNYGLAYVALARALDKQSKLQEAVQVANQAVKLLPSSPFSHLALAQVLMDQKKTGPAGLEAGTAVSVAPLNEAAKTEAKNILSHAWGKVPKLGKQE